MKIKIEKKVYRDPEAWELPWVGEFTLSIPYLPKKYRDKHTFVFEYPLDENFPSKIIKRYLCKTRDEVVLQMDDLAVRISRGLRGIREGSIDIMDWDSEESVSIKI